MMRSHPGDGTCITVRLPIDCEAARGTQQSAKIIHHLSIDPVPVESTSMRADTKDIKLPVKLSA
jgi:hypothetical protein